MIDATRKKAIEVLRDAMSRGLGPDECVEALLEANIHMAEWETFGPGMSMRADAGTVLFALRHHEYAIGRMAADGGFIDDVGNDLGRWETPLRYMQLPDLPEETNA